MSTDALDQSCAAIAEDKLPPLSEQLQRYTGCWSANGRPNGSTANLEVILLAELCMTLLCCLWFLIGVYQREPRNQRGEEFALSTQGSVSGRTPAGLCAAKSRTREAMMGKDEDDDGKDEYETIWVPKRAPKESQDEPQRDPKRSQASKRKTIAKWVVQGLHNTLCQSQIWSPGAHRGFWGGSIKAFKTNTLGSDTPWAKGPANFKRLFKWCIRMFDWNFAWKNVPTIVRKFVKTIDKLPWGFPQLPRRQ